MYFKYFHFYLTHFDLLLFGNTHLMLLHVANFNKYDMLNKPSLACYWLWSTVRQSVELATWTLVDWIFDHEVCGVLIYVYPIVQDTIILDTSLVLLL